MTIIHRIRHKANHWYRQWVRRWFKSYLVGTNFCIISNDCFGGEIYRLAGRAYNTPFVGLMLMGPCYLKMLGDLHFYLAQPLVFLKGSKYFEGQMPYPIATLHDVEIHFMHYASMEEAKEKWERRVARIEWNKIFFVYSIGKDFSTENEYLAFDGLNLKNKLCLGPGRVDGLNCYLQIPEMSKDASIAFRQSLKYLNVGGWLNEGDVVLKTRFQKWRAKLFHECL